MRFVDREPTFQALPATSSGEIHFECRGERLELLDRRMRQRVDLHRTLREVWPKMSAAGRAHS